MLSGLGPRNCLNGTGVDLGITTLYFALPFFFVKELWFVLHEPIVDLFESRGAGLEWLVCCGGVKMAVRVRYGWQNTLREDLG